MPLPLLFLCLLPPSAFCVFCASSPPLPHPSSPSSSSICVLPLRLSLPPQSRHCVHPGTPLYKWTKADHCQQFPQLRSPQISLDSESGILFAERTHCFHGGTQIWIIDVELRCADGEQWKERKMEIRLPPNRQRRWLHRRNPRNSQIHFKEDKYVVELPENVPVRSVAVQVQAHHETDQPLFYTFGASEDSRSANLFSLDTESGEIRIAKGMDREQQARHVLKVLAFERLDPSQSATVSVIVEVLDVQDNAPVFEKATYYAEIREDAPIGTTVLSVFARDFDDGPNGEVEYSLAQAKDGTQLELDGLFSINANSGVVQTAAQLDHESLPALLLLQAVATDRGHPPMRSSANLEIVVLDVNDNVPQFELNGNDPCEATVAEDVQVPAVVLRPRAKDADSGPNGKVHFSIVTMSAPLFSVDYQSGDVTLRERASPKQSPLTLLIRAKDGGQPALFSTLRCTVRIEDVNDHSPVFIGVGPGADGLELFVDEDTPIGQEIGRLLAVDEDIGPNGEVRYRILPPSADDQERVPFELDTNSGALRTKEKLDHELRSDYVFGVVAEDGGDPSRNVTLKVKVRVKDINDNSPVFAQSFYELELEEDTSRGQELLTLKAHDADEGVAGQKLVYRIDRQTPDQGPFALTNLGPEQGALLSLAREFSPKDTEFLLEISATDQGGLRGHCNVSVKVKDVNRPPKFVSHPFLVRIAENAPIGAPVTKMEAVDEDRGDNARLRFGMESEKFSIDPESGLITVRAQLDREVQPIHSVDVRVEDAGRPSLATATTLEIVLDDVNDNAPHFLSESYRASILEDIPVGTSFLQVQAQDPDEGPNGQIDYLLDQEDQFVRMDRFRLDRTSGTLRVNQPLDRENVSRFLLPVVARDRGTPQPLSSRSVIEVSVEDVNDNAPKFEFSSYDLYVPENAPAGTLVGQLRAEDPDQGENGRIQFRIFGGPDAKLFELDGDQQGEPQGTIRIRTRQQFDFEASQNKFTLELQASSSQLSTTVPVRVHVLDTNDHPPQLADPFVVLVAIFMGDTETEKAQTNLTIGQVPAFDPDQNATLEYAMEQSPLLELDAQTGILSLRHAKWERQIDAEHRICVSDGPNSACATAQMHLVPTSTEMLRTGAISVTLEGIRSRDEFLSAATFRRFQQTMAILWDWTVPENIRIFEVEEQPESPEGGTKTVEVNFVVMRDGEETAMSAWRVEEMLTELRSNLSTLFGSRLHLKRDQLCVGEPCPYFQRCRSALRFVDSPAETISTDDFLFRPLSTSRSFGCECPRGFGTNESAPGECNRRLNLCFNSPCLNGATCHQLETGFRCECPRGRTGAFCELATLALASCLPGLCFSGSQCHLHPPSRTHFCSGCPWRSVDSDEYCRLRAVSFGGDSFLAIPKGLSRMEWTLGLSLATISPSGTLLFAGRSDSDFVHLYLEGGLPKVQFSLGGNGSWSGALPDGKLNRVNDGEWHNLRLEYSEWKMRLSLDNCDSQSSLLLGLLSPHCAVEVRAQLAKKCLTDPAVPCHRFLDLSPTIFVGGTGSNGANSDKFVGVVKDLNLDGILVHFSDWDQLDRVGPNIWPGSAQFRPDFCAQKDPNPCPEQTRCTDRWLGHNCRCPLRVHSPRHNCSQLQVGQDPPALTLADDSFAVWSLPSSPAVSLPFSLSFEFRTRERKTQVVTLEFEQATQLLIFSLESGQSMVWVDGEQYLLPYPPLADGNWHSVSAQFGPETVEIAVDVLYKKTIPLLALSAPRSLHSGTVPSTPRPAAFIGCIRNVEWNGRPLSVAEQSGTRNGCLAPNVCQMAQTQCPANSKCVREWDRHVCKCLQGFVGDNCVDVCSVPSICGPSLNSNAPPICVRSPNSTRGYECICPEGRKGQNCERESLAAECPRGWFGQFPRCKACNCPTENGFADKCNGTDGSCICREGTFLKERDEEEAFCVPCECGYGTVPGMGDRCDQRSGQCKCAGEATGRQCDRCDQRGSKLPILLERRSLKCVPIHGRCPSEMDSGIQWPTTAVGTSARHSCPVPLMGIATRGCALGGIWLSVNDFNCTLPALYELQNNIQNLNLFELSRRLANATANRLSGRNLGLAVDLFGQLVRREIGPNGPNLAESARNVGFSRDLCRIGDTLLSAVKGNAELHQQIMNILAIYGTFLAQLHREQSFLRPFQMGGRNLVFSIDAIPIQSKDQTAQIILPKKDQFLRFSPHQKSQFIRFRVLLDLPASSTSSSPNKSSPAPPSPADLHTFYALILPSDPDHSSATLAFHISGTSSDLLKSVFVTLPIVPSTFDHPECIVGHIHAISTNDLDEKMSWTSAQLTGVNGTHLECRVDRPRMPMLIRGVPSQRPTGILFFPFAGSSFGHGSDYRAANVLPGPMPLLSTFLALFAFALLAFTFGLAFCRHCHRCRLLRCTLISVFSLNALALQMAHRLQLGHNDQLLCSARNALLAFSLCALFAWLFFYALHLCKLILQSAENECHRLAITLGVLLPLLIGTCEFALSQRQKACHIPLGSAPFWPLVLPSAIFCLLNFYSLATSWLLSWHKQYQIALTRLSLRRALFAHSLLVFLCALLTILDLFSLFQSHRSSPISGLNAILLAFVAIHLFLWANFFAPNQPNPSLANNSNNSKSAESMWMAREQQEDAGGHGQNVLLCPDSNSKSTNFYAHSPFHRGISPSKRRPRLNDGKIYEGIPNEWVPPTGDSGGALLGEHLSYLHHTLQRSLEVDLPRILSPPQRPVPPSSMVVIDGNWGSMEADEETQEGHFLSSTLPIGGGAFNAVNSPLRRQQIERRHHHHQHYGSVRTIGDNSETATPMVARRRTQPIQFGNESPRNRRFGPGNALDDELNSAYFTFTRRREQTAKSSQSQDGPPAVVTTFN